MIPEVQREMLRRDFNTMQSKYLQAAKNSIDETEMDVIQGLKDHIEAMRSRTPAIVEEKSDTEDNLSSSKGMEKSRSDLKAPLMRMGSSDVRFPKAPSRPRSPGF